ncbi:hypothetical protein ACFV1W_29260 [Kitasatospora sp. NPDC059648]|uniref:hypothetical protein n=1 Tax=Kitasatospora sp. NPDC059648 TaxID=3346894 RepID=UPI0036C9930B
MTNVLPDADLVHGYDVEAAITRGLLIDDVPRQVLFGEAAIAASYQAEALRIGPYPLGFLAQYVRTGGFSTALDLPEPVIGREASELVRGWLRLGVRPDLHRPGTRNHHPDLGVRQRGRLRPRCTEPCGVEVRRHQVHPGTVR